MHKSLTESLHLGRSRIRSCHLCEIGIHAGIPTAETQNVPVCFKVADIETLTGRADEGAGAAPETGFRKIVPCRIGKEFIQMIRRKTGKIQIGKRKKFYLFSRLSSRFFRFGKICFF